MKSRRVIVALVLAILMPFGPGVTAASAASASSAQGIVVAAAPKRVTPLIHRKWWGFEVRLTRLQTDVVAITGGGAVVLTGWAAPVVWAVQSVIGSTAAFANQKGLCAGVNVPWIAFTTAVPLAGPATVLIPKIIPVVYRCS